MKNRRNKFLFSVFALAFWFTLGTFEIAAQPNREKVLAQLTEVGKCFTENEVAVAAITNEGGGLRGNDDTLSKLNRSLPHLQKLVDCADRGTKIIGLPPKMKRELAARRRLYAASQETFKLQTCVFGKLNEAEAGMPEVTEKIAARNKAAANLKLLAVRLDVGQAKLCAAQGIASKTIPVNLKTGFRENTKRADELLAEIEKLKKEIEAMPD